MLEDAKFYASHGWPVFPCKPGAKTPITKNGFKDATANLKTITQWWTRTPEANVAVPTGSQSRLFVLDVDGDIGAKSLAGLTYRYGPLPETAQTITGGGGRHILFQHFAGARNTAGQIGPGLDTRGEGGYIILPPSKLDGGGHYEWVGGCAPAFRDIAEAPAWLRGERQSDAGQGNLDFDSRLVPGKHDGSPAAPGGRNNACASLAGQWLTAGMDYQTILAKAREWNQGNPVPLTDNEIERTVASVTATHLRKNPAAVVALTPERIEVSEPFVPPVRAEPKKLSPSLLYPQGGLGDLVRWIVDSALYPQPELALGNALAFAGAVMGRKVSTAWNLRTNFYCLGVADSGAGKDHSRQAIKRLCEELEIGQKMLAGEDVSSDSAILEAVYRMPSCLFLFDEIGHMVAASSSKYSASHVRGIPVALTKLFSSAGTMMLGKEYADNKLRPRKDIIQPNACIYGTTVPGRLAGGITSDELRDGFLGRMLVFQASNQDPEQQKPTNEQRAIPVDVKDWVLHWWTRDVASHGNLEAVRPEPSVVYCCEGVESVFSEMGAAAREHKIKSRDERKGFDALWARTEEHAHKIALVIACTQDYHKPAINRECADHACRLAWELTECLVEWVGDNVGDNDYHRDSNRVRKIIQDSGEITSSQLTRKTQWLERKSRESILSSLIEAGIVDRVFVKTNTKSAQAYRFAG